MLRSWLDRHLQDGAQRLFHFEPLEKLTCLKAQRLTTYHVSERAILNMPQTSQQEEEQQMSLSALSAALVPRRVMCQQARQPTVQRQRQRQIWSISPHHRPWLMPALQEEWASTWVTVKISPKACLAEVLPPPRGGTVPGVVMNFMNDVHDHWRLRRHDVCIMMIPRKFAL